MTDYNQHLSEVFCEHKRITFKNNEKPVCEECNQIIYFMSDIQIKYTIDKNIEYANGKKEDKND